MIPLLLSMTGNFPADLGLFMVIILTILVVAAVLIELFFPDELTDEDIEKLKKK